MRWRVAGRLYVYYSLSPKDCHAEESKVRKHELYEAPP